MPRSYDGDLFVTIGANTDPADKKIDALFDRIETLQHVNIDANINTLQRKLDTLAKRTNEQLSTGLVKGMLKDFRTVLGAMKTEFERHGPDTVIYKNLDKTVRAFESRFENLSVSVGKKQFAGLEQILNNVSELESISGIKFGSFISSKDVQNSDSIVQNVKQIKKDLDSIVNKIDYVSKTLKKDADSALSEQKLKGYEQRVLGLQEALKSFSEIDSPLIKSSLLNATVKAAEVLGQISDKQAIAAQRQADAQKEIEKSQKNVASGKKEETKLVEDLGNAADQTAKKLERTQKKVAKAFDVSKATKKYNEIMEKIGHATGADGLGLGEMLVEAKKLLDTYNEIGHANHNLKSENLNAWKSITASLRGFLNSYVKYYDDSAEAIYEKVQEKKKEYAQYRAPDWDNSVLGNDDKYLAFKQSELELEEKRLQVMKELVQLSNKYHKAPSFTWKERLGLDAEGDAIDTNGLAGRLKDYEEGLEYSRKTVERIAQDIENKRRIASPKYTPITTDGQKTAWGSTEDPKKAYKYIRDQHWSMVPGVRLDLNSMAKESPDEASKKYLETRREINDILKKEKLGHQDIIKLLEVYNQKSYQTLTQSRYIADAINMAADIEKKLGRGSDFAYDNYLTGVLSSLNEPGKMMSSYFDAFAGMIAKQLGVGAQNEISISSYQDLYKALERIVDLSKQLKPGFTAEYSELQEIMSKAEYPENRDDLIANIRAQIDNVKRIKSSIKNGLSVYQYRDGSGYEAQYGIDQNTLKDAERMLNAYIYQAVEHFGYTVSDVMNDFSQKRARAFVENAINQYLGVASQNETYQVEAEVFNEPIQAVIESITSAIYGMTVDSGSLDKVSDYVSELKNRPEDVTRYTLSAYSNHVGSLLGINTPYAEIEANAKKIASYEELCEVISRYNELQDKAVVFGGHTDPGLGEAEEMERQLLRARLTATGGKDIFKLAGFSGFRDIKEVAKALGIEHKPIEVPVTPTVAPGTVQAEIVESASAPVEVPVTPVVQDGSAKLALGASGTTFAGKQSINFKYAVMSVDDLVMSHDAYGNTNSKYPSELQPRDRSRIMSSAQILGMAKSIIPELLTSSPTAQNGSPIVNSDGIVIGGNARSIALTEAYKNGHADGYSAYIKEHASEFGLDANNLPKKPVLVRVVEDRSDLGQLAKQLNASTTAGYSTAEQAMLNEELVMKVISKLNLDESANLNAASNREFISAFIHQLSDGQKNEMVTSDGSLSAIGLVKTKQAITGAAYGSREMLENLEQVNPELLNVSNALMTVAAKAADMRYQIESGGLTDIGAISTILNGVDLLKSSKHSGYNNIEEYLGQQSMFGTSYSAEDVAIGRFIESNIRNVQQLTNMFGIILDLARNVGDPMQVSFDGITSMSLEDVIKGAFDQYAEKYQKKISYDDLASGYLAAEAGSRSDKRVDRTLLVPADVDIERDKVQQRMEESVGDKPIEVPAVPAPADKKTKKKIKKIADKIPEDNEPVAPILETLDESKKMIDLLSSAAGKSAATKFLEGITSETDLQTRVVSYFNEVFGGDDWKFKEGKGAYSIVGDTYTAHLVNGAKDTLDAVFKLNDGVIELQSNLTKFNGANIEPFDVGKAIDEASAKVEKLRLELGDIPYDGMSKLEDSLEAIYDEKSLKAFNEQLKISEKEIKKIADDTKWVIDQNKQLDSKVRLYRYGSKTLDGSTALEDADLTSMEESADQTIDGLVDHIRESLKNVVAGTLTDGMKNVIRNDLRVLENEIKVGQLNKYTSTTMSASEAEAARKVLINQLDTLKEQAKQKNVFDAISDSYDNFYDRLTNKQNENYIETNFSDAINGIRVIRSELSKAVAELGSSKQEKQNLDSALKAQEKLYESRKKLVKLQLDKTTNASDLQAAERATQELEQQYNASLKLLKTEDDRNIASQRELQLKDELRTVAFEQSDIQLQKARLELQEERIQAQKEEKAGQDALLKVQRDQDKLYEQKRKHAKLTFDESAADSDIRIAERKIEELERQYEVSLQLLRATEDLEAAKRRELQLEDELTDFVIEQYNAQQQRLEDAEERNNEAQTKREKALYNAYEDAREKEEEERKRKLKEDQEKLIKLQKKYNTADYNWHLADIDGRDKSPYNEEMESYVAQMEELRKTTKLTAEQEIELNRINNEHLLKKQKLLNAAAAADSASLAELQTFYRWKSDIKNIGMLSDETVQRIENMGNAIADISSSSDIKKLAENFKVLKSDVKYETTQSKATKTKMSQIKADLAAEKKELDALYKSLNLDLDLGDAAPNADAIKQSYKEATAEIQKCTSAIGEQNQEELAASKRTIELAKAQMNARQEAEYKWWYGDGGPGGPSGPSGPGGGGPGDNPPFDDKKIKQWYQSLNATIQQISKIETKMHSLMNKDDGTGAWMPLIQSLDSQKSALLDKVRDISKEINDAFGGQFVLGEQVDLPFSNILSGIKDFDASGVIANFFGDIRTQTVLGEQSIEKFVSTLQGAQNKTEEFSTAMSETIYSTWQSSETTLANLYQKGLVDPQNDKYQLAVKELQAYKEAILEVTDESTGKLTDPASWTVQQVIGFIEMTNALKKYTSEVETGAIAEAKYFESKKQYANIASMQDYDQVTANMKEQSKNTDDARSKLEDYVKAMTQGKGIITGFTQDANGISRIDFSVLEEGTGYLRNFSAEMGQFTSNIYAFDTSMNNMTAGTNAAKNALASMQQIMNRLNQRGMTADNNDYVKQLQERYKALSSLFTQYGSSKNVGDQNMLQNKAAEAEHLIGILTALEKAHAGVQSAMSSGDKESLGSFDKNIDSYKQLANYAKELANTMDGSVRGISNFKNGLKGAEISIGTTSGEIKKFIVDVDDLSKVMTHQLVSTEKMKSGWQELGSFFTGSIGKGIKNFAQVFLSTYDIIRYVRKGFNEVLEIDTAMTELKKVTDETDLAYSRFLENAYTSSQKIGTTMKDFTQATADFARLNKIGPLCGDIQVNIYLKTGKIQRWTIPWVM